MTEHCKTIEKKRLFKLQSEWSQRFATDDIPDGRAHRSLPSGSPSQEPWSALQQTSSGTSFGENTIGLYNEFAALSETVYCWTDDDGYEFSGSGPDLRELREIMKGRDSAAIYVCSYEPRAWTFVIFEPDSLDEPGFIFRVLPLE